MARNEGGKFSSRQQANGLCANESGSLAWLSFVKEGIHDQDTLINLVRTEVF